jgi:hypothetical protein
MCGGCIFFNENKVNMKYDTCWLCLFFHKLIIIGVQQYPSFDMGDKLPGSSIHRLYAMCPRRRRSVICRTTVTCRYSRDRDYQCYWMCVEYRRQYYRRWKNWELSILFRERLSKLISGCMEYRQLSFLSPMITPAGVNQWLQLYAPVQF